MLVPQNASWMLCLSAARCVLDHLPVCFFFPSSSVLRAKHLHFVRHGTHALTKKKKSLSILMFFSPLFLTCCLSDSASCCSSAVKAVFTASGTAGPLPPLFQTTECGDCCARLASPRGLPGSSGSDEGITVGVCRA